MARKDRFLVALGVKCTLTDRAVEQYPRLQQSTLTYRPVTSKLRSKRVKLSTLLRYRGSTESDGCSSSLRMDDIHVGPGQQVTKAAALHDSSNDSDNDSNSRVKQWCGPFESN